MKRNFSYTALLLIAAGCGGAANKYDAVVTGTVTVNGELAKSGTVTFHPVDEGKVAIGRIHSDGSYSLRTGQGDLQQIDGGTVEPGDYIVTVSVTAPSAEGPLVAEGGPPIPGPSLVAARYASTQTSDLKRTVKAGSQIVILELEAAEISPPAEEAASSTAEEQSSEPGGAASEDNPTSENQPQKALGPDSTVTEESAAAKSAENAQP